MAWQDTVMAGSLVTIAGGMLATYVQVRRNTLYLEGDDHQPGLVERVRRHGRALRREGILGRRDPDRERRAD
jgi:hypothetical protein